MVQIFTQFGRAGIISTFFKNLNLKMILNHVPPLREPSQFFEMHVIPSLIWRGLFSGVLQVELYKKIEYLGKIFVGHFTW